MKIKTSELNGVALDWAVENTILLDRVGNPEQRSAIATRNMRVRGESCSYCLNWAHGGPIIDNIKGLQFKQWLESKPETCCEAHIHNYDGDWIQFGPTTLIAAMRCYVASKLGDEVEIPDELA